MGLKLRYAKRYEVKWSGTGHFNYLQEDLNHAEEIDCETYWTEWDSIYFD